MRKIAILVLAPSLALSVSGCNMLPGASIDYGDDTSTWANDGECDDLRFTGDYASEMIYLTEDIGHDANDCRAAVRKGTARWQMDSLPIELGATAAATEEDAAEAAADAVAEAFDET